MAIKFESIKVGDVLVDEHSQRMGNTTMRELGVWYVEVLEINAETREALVSWNNNKPEWRSAKRMERLRRKPSKRYEEQRERRIKRGW